jgi:uncharacterized protein YndB with AHSA1/START domain
MEEAIEIQITIAARRSIVYRFLSNADGLRQWIGPDADFDPTPGGELAIRYPNGDVARGKFVELTPNQRIVFTWGYERSANNMAPGSSTVTIELSDADSGTRVTLRHAGIPTEAARKGHMGGWKHYTTRLADVSVTEEMRDRLGPAIEFYLRAWNEPQETQRNALLEQCWEPNAWFCDRMGRTTARDELSRYIGATLQFAPTMKIELTGTPQQTHEFIRFDWRILLADHVHSTGTNFGRLNFDGRFESMVGFWNA